MSPREPLAVVRIERPRCPTCKSADIYRRTGQPLAGGTYVRYMGCRSCGRYHIQMIEPEENNLPRE